MTNPSASSELFSSGSLDVSIAVAARGDSSSKDLSCSSTGSSKAQRLLLQFPGAATLVVTVSKVPVVREINGRTVKQNGVVVTVVVAEKIDIPVTVFSGREGKTNRASFE